MVRPKYSSIVANLEPFGLEYIVGLANKLKIRTYIHDEFQYSWLLRYMRLKRLIRLGHFNIVGFNANANTVDYIRKTAARLKRDFPKIYIMAGGPEAEQNYRDFATDDIDMVYYDNGLQTLKNIFENGFSTDVLKNQHGVGFKENGQWIFTKKGEPVSGFIVEPNRSAFYAGLKKNFIFMKGKYALCKASFSCPFACAFCYCTKMNSGRYTERDIFKVVDEVEQIRHDKIWFVDDTFFYDKERVRIFCNEIIRRGIKKNFMAYSRADFIAENPDILPLAYKAGFRDILVGLEAITDELLDAYNKQTSKNDNIMAIKNLHDNNIVCDGLFVISYTAGREDFKKLLKFIKDNNLLWVVFGIFTPYKGTDAYSEYKDRVVNFRSSRLDGTHITIKPTRMSSFEFMMRYYWLHVLTYPKIMVRTLFGTGYDTKRTGWI